MRRSPHLLLAVCLAVAGCGPTDRTPPGLYDYYCARCHLADGSGDPKSLDLHPGIDLRRSEMLAEKDRGRTRQRIAEGHGPMPAYRRKLSVEEIDQLADFVINSFSE